VEPFERGVILGSFPFESRIERHEPPLLGELGIVTRYREGQSPPVRVTGESDPALGKSPFEKGDSGGF
jgi:hypothetical protein